MNKEQLEKTIKAFNEGYKKSREQLLEETLVEIIVDTLSKGYNLGRQEMDQEWRDKIELKSVDELKEKMGVTYTNLSLQVSYKEGYNRALKDLLK